MRIVFLWLLICNAAAAETIWVSQSGAGAETGVDAANAHSAAWFNTAANWGGGAGEIDPGDTVMLTGTFTGSAGGNMLTTQASGTAGNLITVMFDTGCVLTATYWSGTSGAILVNGHDYIAVDGGANGVIIATANGTALANQQNSFGVELAAGSDHCQVSRLTITDLYVRTAGSADTAGSSTTGIHFTDSGGNNLVWSNTIVNTRGGISFLHSGNVTGDKIFQNTISKRDSGIVYASSASGVATGVYIYSNNIGSAIEWDEPGDTFHHDGMHFFTGGGQSGHLSNAVISANTFLGDRGDFSTADIFFEDSHTNCWIFNNLHTNSVAGNAPSDGYIFIKGNGTASRALVANNTIALSGVGGSAIGVENSSTCTVENNLVYGIGAVTTTGLSLHDATSLTGATLNRNIYYTAGTMQWYDGTSIYSTLATWRTATSQEAQSTTSQPTLTASYVPAAEDTAAKGQGTDLSAYFTADKAGLLRTVPWDIGAYRFDVASTTWNVTTLNPAVINVGTP